ncbi:hypothetical protein JR316_0013002 [Psilocybe cubensis]|uniref:Uncharacterized protein n=1 Tax=Psilocybe cubensis TaxID=181762 RepID=A0ACB8GGI8_PSICU|nr:hypothetical protein JR316_0013002 [Psilocybe cubensis]KAH9474540.1 hypothetical protein JR316_0013002 [Psilocybe cubensis]
MPSDDDSSCPQDRNGTNEQPNMPQETNSDLPKMWSIEDPFQYAPPKPDGDPWTILLEPLLKDDKLRCDAWKDEVQNLLIFAGLFSAVVTTFLVESYKDLQPDPSGAMITLLAHIAARLDNDTGVITSTSLSSNDPFVPSASTIRVNVFWFISLVLSLTTVLVGTISLQWLREHQSYSDISDQREKYAIFYMRKHGLEKWRVDRIFTVMPLLLQTALVLFLGGLIDFLHAFSERWSVVIPVAAVIGLSLLFLVTTTILPTLQTMALFITPSNWPHPPSQCPFKSPQSHAVRRLCAPLLSIQFYLTRSSTLFTIQSLISRLPRAYFISEMISRFTVPSRFRSQVSLAACCGNWDMFDQDWVILRDMYMRRSFGDWSKDYGNPYDFGFGHDELLPLFDIVFGLNSQKWQNNVANAAYHCISEVSQAVLLHLTDPDQILPQEGLRENDYLYSLLAVEPDNVSVTSFFDTTSWFRDIEMGELLPANVLTCILHQQNLASFTHWNGGMLVRHQKELALRLFGYFYQKPHKLHLSHTKIRIPACVSFQNFVFYSSLADRDRDFRDKDTFEALSWQFSNLTLCIFKQICEDFHPHSLVHTPFAQEVGLPFYLEVSGYITSRTLSPSIHSSESSAVFLATKEMIHDTFSYIRLKLDTEVTAWGDDQAKPSLLFYLTVCYTQQLIGPLSKDETFNSLRETILQYKKRTIDIGIIDSVLERRLIAILVHLVGHLRRKTSTKFYLEWSNIIVKDVQSVNVADYIKL